LVIFGLGNPLLRYKETRHNVGFMVVDRLSKKLSIRFIHHSDYYIAHTKDTAKINITLIKPMLYMNNSGIVVSEYIQSIKSSTESPFFIVVCDDLALPLGKIRIREKGSDGGHQGLASVIYHLQTINFPRLRIGIGQPPLEISATDYVLTKFSPEESPILDNVLEVSCTALTMIEKSGIKAAMNKYNPMNFTGEYEIK
jgi:PTH1 family peptidyl-tRNA hydrolase